MKAIVQLANVIAVILGCAAIASADPPGVAEQRALFEELKSDVKKPLEEFEGKYIDRLNSVRAEARKRADLDKVIAIDEEIEKFRAGSTIPGRYADLKELRKIYETHSARIEGEVNVRLRNLYLTHVGKLTELRDAATKESRIDDAVAINSIITALEQEIPSEPKPFASGLPAKPSPDLIAHWTFDRDGADSSGKRRHLKLIGAKVVADGKFGGALQTEKGTYAEAPDDPVFDLQHPFTIAAWLKIDEGATVGAWAPIVTKANATWRLQMSGDGRRPVFHANSASGNLAADSAPGDELTKGEWYHIAATFDGRASTLYVNGTEKARRERGTEEKINLTPRRVRIGGNSFLQAQGIPALIDDVRLYERALSGDEIRALVAGP